MTLPEPNLQNAKAPLNEAKSMPAGFYTSPEIFTAEKQYIFLKHWFFACRTDQVPNAGDYLTLDTIGGPVLLIRGEDNKLRAFANFCRHCGSILLERTGNCKRIVCPYHACSYFNDGRLYSCPDMADAEGFDRIENGLIPVSLEIWEGFVFLTFNPAPLPLLDHLGDLPARMKSHKLGDMRCTWKVELPSACNWKLLLENAMETYHTGTVHRDNVGAQDSRTLETIGNWLCIQVTSGRSIATLPGAPPPFPAIDGLDEDAQMGTYFTVLHPTCQFVMAQDCMWWLNVHPVAHDKSVLEVGGCFPASVVNAGGFETKAAPYYERWIKVAEEDVDILERQQKALGSVLYKPSPLSWREDQVQALSLWVLDQLPEGAF